MRAPPSASEPPQRRFCPLIVTAAFAAHQPGTAVAVSTPVWVERSEIGHRDAPGQGAFVRFPQIRRLTHRSSIYTARLSRTLDLGPRWRPHLTVQTDATPTTEPTRALPPSQALPPRARPR